MTSQRTVAVEAPVEPLIAPVRLISDNRLEFRRAALESLERAAEAGVPAVEVDMSACVELDASGLGVLVLLQKRARERDLNTRLLHVTRPVRLMIAITRLESLFEFEPKA
ncbi:MAG TPA: STAS domain-containing protein [Gemmatimonadaceae bacterium]|nr:STAS domain-containing protein [Gemmatimonadaceae bacterium]